MVYLGGDQALLFGGIDVNNLYGDTWVYDLSANNWTNQTPAAAPPARCRHAMTSLGMDQALLFRGGTGSGYDAETWLATGFFTPVRA